MAKFNEGDKFRVAHSLKIGVVKNNNCNGTYEVQIGRFKTQFFETEMRKIESLRTIVETRIINMMESSTTKIIVSLLIAVIVTIALAFILN